jgi:mRNA interferase RelE/StbE
MKRSGTKSYKLEYLDSIDQSYLRRLSRADLKRIKSAIETKLVFDPFRSGKPLQHSWRGHFRMRIGDYRLVYRINEDKATIIVVAIGHRKDVYET